MMESPQQTCPGNMALKLAALSGIYRIVIFNHGLSPMFLFAGCPQGSGSACQMLTKSSVSLTAHITPCPSQPEQFWCLLFPAPGTGSPQVTPFSFTNTSALCLVGHKEKALRTELSFHSSVITALQHFLSSVKIPYHPSAVFPCYMYSKGTNVGGTR